MNRLFLALAAALATTALAHGQESRADLRTFNNTSITTNGNGAITGYVANSMFGQIITSSGLLSDTNLWTGINTFGIPINVASGGTNSSTAPGARTNLGAAASGANTDITSLSGLTTPISVPQGGTNSASGDLSALFVTPANGPQETLATLASAIVNPSASVQGTGIPGINGGHFFVYSAPTTNTYDTTSTLRVQRKLTGQNAVGSAGTTANLWSLLDTNPFGAHFEWAITAQVNNYALALTASQNVGVNGTIFRQPYPTIALPTTAASGDGTTATLTFGGSTVYPVGDSVIVSGVTPSGYNGTYKVTASSAGSVSYLNATTGAQTVAGTVYDTSIGYSTGGNFNCTDNTTEVDPIKACIGAELDANATTASTDALGNRVGLLIAGGSVPGAVIGSAIKVVTNGGATYDRLLKAVGTYNVSGLDFTNATVTAAVMLAAGQRVVFDGGTGGAFNRSMFVQSGALVYNTQNGQMLKIVDTGQTTTRYYQNFNRTYSQLTTDFPCSGTTASLRAWITDSTVQFTSANVATAVAGGGAFASPVICNGTSYVIGG